LFSQTLELELLRNSRTQFNSCIYKKRSQQAFDALSKPLFLING